MTVLATNTTEEQSILQNALASKNCDVLEVDSGHVSYHMVRENIKEQVKRTWYETFGHHLGLQAKIVWECWIHFPMASSASSACFTSYCCMGLILY